MSVALPKAVDYSEPMYALPPNTQSFQIVSNPVSGSTFQANQSIDVDLGSRGFLDPKSLFIRYKMDVADASLSYISGTPVYSPFLRVQTMMNSQVVENINSYNVVSNMLVNLTKDNAQKLGEQFAYGYFDISSSPVDNESTDGGTFAINGNKSLSAPLFCALSSCEKLVPLFLLNGIRLTFTLDSISNIFATLDNAGVSTAANLPTSYTISNFEVVYTMVDFGDDVKNMVYAMDKVRLKSQTWATSIQPIPANVSGNQNLIYNHKYSSVKALFLNMGGGDRTKSANGNFDSYNVANAGEYSFQIGGLNYPQRPLSAGNNNAGILQMLRQAIGSVFDKTNALSINAVEWVAPSGDVTAPIKPNKFWVGVSTEKLKIPGSFFTGISTESSPITATINISGLNTQQIHNVMLVLNADLIFEIDPQSKQVVVVQ